MSGIVSKMGDLIDVYKSFLILNIVFDRGFIYKTIRNYEYKTIRNYIYTKPSGIISKTRDFVDF